MLGCLFYFVISIAIFDLAVSFLAYIARWINKYKFDLHADHIQYSIMLWTATGVLHFIRTTH